MYIPTNISKKHLILLSPILALLVVAVLAAAPADQAKEEEHLIRAADNHTYGQDVVNETMKRHSDELMGLMLFAVPPGQKKLQAVAGNSNEIGEGALPSEVEIVDSRMTILRPNRIDPTKFNIKMPLYSASGDLIGLIKIILRYDAKAGRELELHKRAIAIREEVAKKLPNQQSLFDASH